MLRFFASDPVLLPLPSRDGLSVLSPLFLQRFGFEGQSGGEVSLGAIPPGYSLTSAVEAGGTKLFVGMQCSEVVYRPGAPPDSRGLAAGTSSVALGAVERVSAGVRVRHFVGLYDIASSSLEYLSMPLENQPACLCPSAHSPTYSCFFLLSGRVYLWNVVSPVVAEVPVMLNLDPGNAAPDGGPVGGRQGGCAPARMPGDPESLSDLSQLSCTALCASPHLLLVGLADGSTAALSYFDKSVCFILEPGQFGPRTDVSSGFSPGVGTMIAAGSTGGTKPLDHVSSPDSPAVAIIVHNRALGVLLVVSKNGLVSLYDCRRVGPFRLFATRCAPVTAACSTTGGFLLGTSGGQVYDLRLLSKSKDTTPYGPEEGACPQAVGTERLAADLPDEGMIEVQLAGCLEIAKAAVDHLCLRPLPGSVLSSKWAKKAQGIESPSSDGQMGKAALRYDTAVFEVSSVPTHAAEAHKPDAGVPCVIVSSSRIVSVAPLVQLQLDHQRGEEGECEYESAPLGASPGLLDDFRDYASQLKSLARRACGGAGDSPAGGNSTAASPGSEGDLGGPTLRQMLATIEELGGVPPESGAVFLRSLAEVSREIGVHAEGGDEKDGEDRESGAEPDPASQEGRKEQEEREKASADTSVVPSDSPGASTGQTDAIGIDFEKEVLRVLRDAYNILRCFGYRPSARKGAGKSSSGAQRAGPFDTGKRGAPAFVQCVIDSASCQEDGSAECEAIAAALECAVSRDLPVLLAYSLRRVVRDGLVEIRSVASSHGRFLDEIHHWLRQKLCAVEGADAESREPRPRDTDIDSPFLTDRAIAEFRRAGEAILGIAVGKISSLLLQAVEAPVVVGNALLVLPVRAPGFALEEPKGLAALRPLDKAGKRYNQEFQASAGWMAFSGISSVPAELPLSAIDLRTGQRYVVVKGAVASLPAGEASSSPGAQSVPQASPAPDSPGFQSAPVVESLQLSFAVPHFAGAIRCYGVPDGFVPLSDRMRELGERGALEVVCSLAAALLRGQAGGGNTSVFPDLIFVPASSPSVPAPPGESTGSRLSGAGRRPVALLAPGTARAVGSHECVYSGIPLCSPEALFGVETAASASWSLGLLLLICLMPDRQLLPVYPQTGETSGPGRGGHFLRGMAAISSDASRSLSKAGEADALVSSLAQDYGVPLSHPLWAALRGPGSQEEHRPLAPQPPELEADLMLQGVSSGTARLVARCVRMRSVERPSLAEIATHLLSPQK